MNRRPRRRVFEALALAAGLGALGLLFALFGVRDVAATLAAPAPGYLALYLLLGSLVRFGFSLRWFLVARALGPAPSLSRFVAARLGGDAAGALVPAGSVGGDPLRILLLYGRGVPGATAGASVALDRILEVMGNTITSLVYVTVFSFSFTDWPGSVGRTLGVLVLFLVLLASIGAPLVLLRLGLRPLTCTVPRRWAEGRPRLARALGGLRKVEDDLTVLLRERPAVVLWGVAGSLAIEGLVVLEYKLLLTAFGIEIAWSTLLMVLVTVGAVRAVPVPGSLGTLEVGQVTLLKAVRGRGDLGFLVGVVLRLHETWWTLVGLLTLSRQGFSLARLRSTALGEKVVAERAVA